MSIENPFNKPPEKKKENEPIKGDNFVMGGKGRTPSRTSFSSHDTSVEFRPGATNEGKIKAKEEATKIELERTAEYLLSSMLETNNPYSETFKIKSDGKFDKILRVDCHLTNDSLLSRDTPAELYQMAAEIEKKHPEYKFTFETDREGKWMKYTVSKSESGN